MLALLLASCGGRTEVPRVVDASAPDAVVPRPEVCNGLDDDLDGRVDQPFRDEEGRYVDDAHCGGCGRPCRAVGPVLESRCAVVLGQARCVATRCAEGFVPSSTGRCVPRDERLCLPCTEDAACGDFEGARCALVGGERRCTVDCALGCAEGYRCDPERLVCVPEGGGCDCGPGQRFEVACGIETEMGLCVGRARCEDGVTSACETREEVCNEVDDDCDGEVDEGFRDERGAYSLDLHHCGACGVDCTADAIPGVELTCGGDPFAPRCVVRCPDLDDGLDPGDRVDADGDIATGCECVVRSVEDEPGPVGAEGDRLDTNCDGADGVVVRSFYVAPDGDDAGPGSPTRPLRTIGEALRRAAESLRSDRPRPHVFVASGVYAESLELPEGVHLHGGYRRDFRALDPEGLRSEVRAPADTTAPGGAALLARGVGREPTTVEGLALLGADAQSPSAPAFGAVLVDPGPELRLRGLTIRAGRGGPGMPGRQGEPGSSPPGPGADGEPPRGAVENAAHACLPADPRNLVRGGAGARHRCGEVDVSGGDGGSARCPRFAEFQGDGQRGRGGGAGTGGHGGQDSRGPIPADRGACGTGPVCCGLADFTVPTDFQGPAPGAPGSDGRAGRPGRACADPLGSWRGETWVPDRGTAGTDGSPGSGGGGGGAGGGAEIDWFDGLCEFADGLGGGGGGGGAGGCGGTGGAPGTSGGPSIALLLRYTRPSGVPRLEALSLRPGDGGEGGDGGAGGEGGLGSSGGQGGALPREARSTPTLAGPFPGARGGPGGQGGSGGGGGGGCGGPSVGIWVTGDAPAAVPADRWRGRFDFRLGRPGRGGRGGGGPSAAPDGADGTAVEVLVR